MITLVGPEYPKYVIPMIDNAKNSIDVITYDWRWYADKPSNSTQQLNIAMVNAVHRGVRVRAVLNIATQAVFLSTVGILARGLKDKRVLHSKVLIFDRKSVVLGSHNLTSNAFHRNIECSVVFDLEPDDTRLLDFFDNIYGL